MTLSLKSFFFSHVSLNSAVLRLRGRAIPSVLGEKFLCICLLLILVKSITDFVSGVNPAEKQKGGLWGKLWAAVSKELGRQVRFHRSPGSEPGLTLHAPSLPEIIMCD